MNGLPGRRGLSGRGSRACAEPSAGLEPPTLLTIEGARHAARLVAVPTDRDSYAFRDKQGELLRALVSALCAARWRTVAAHSGTPDRGRPGPTRAIGGTRRGPTRRERVRLRQSVQSLCPLDAWRTLREEPWRKYRHHFTATEERVRPAGGLVVAEEPTTRGARALRRPQVHLSVAFAAACAG